MSTIEIQTTVSESVAVLKRDQGTQDVISAAIEIEQRVVSKVSMMPEGLLQRLTPDEVRDLFAYLTGQDQVPLPADANGVPVEKPM